MKKRLLGPDATEVEKTLNYELPKVDKKIADKILHTHENESKNF